MGLTPVVVAVDGGGSKTDVVALTLDGDIVGRRRGPGSSPQYKGIAASVALVDELVRDVAGRADVLRTGLYLSGLDLPKEVTEYRGAVAGMSWATHGLDVENDLFALLRAGTESPDAVAVICGTGMNAIGVRADGASVRFFAIGAISGDWGGGHGLGAEALWHAARDLDGRGPHTALTAAVAEQFGMPVTALIEQLHFGQRESTDLARLAPAVFDAADDGDPIAATLADRQADEVVAYVRACLTRLDLGEREVPVVLGGGILQAAHPRLQARIASGIAELAPAARPVTLRHPPIVGAALLTLTSALAGPEAIARARASLV